MESEGLRSEENLTHEVALSALKQRGGGLSWGDAPGFGPTRLQRDLDGKPSKKEIKPTIMSYPPRHGEFPEEVPDPGNIPFVVTP